MPNRILLSWYMQVPVVTRTFFTVAFLTSLAVRLRIINPYLLYFSWSSVLQKRQLWRLVTPFLFVGELDPQYIVVICLTAQYSRMLEEQSYYGRPLKFVKLLVFAMASLLLLSEWLRLPFLSAPMTYVIMYVWSRRSPHMRVAFLGILAVNAPYLPWVCLGFSALLNQDSSWKAGLCGILIGHVYYFFEDIWPRVRMVGVSQTPPPPPPSAAPAFTPQQDTRPADDATGLDTPGEGRAAPSSAGLEERQDPELDSVPQQPLRASGSAGQTSSL